MKKTIFITGTSSGLGKRMAKYFARQGWNVVATMRKPEEEKELSNLQNIKVIQLDVTRKESIEQAMQKAISTFGKIDVVVNNAGVGIYGPLELTEEADIERIYAVNVKGVIDVIRLFTPHFRSHKSGKFINISSVMGLSAALPLGSLYNMTKFAMEGLTEGLYVELKSQNIDLHLVEPGGFSSDFGENTTFAGEDIHRDYGNLIRKVSGRILASQKPGTLPDPTAIIKTVHDLATGSRNNFRTAVGKDARQLLLMRKLLSIDRFLRVLFKQFTN